MRYFYRLLCLSAAIALSGCLAPGTQTAAPPGSDASEIPFSVDSPIVAQQEETGSKDGPPDVTLNQPGPGGSMPSGEVAPPPLVPVNFSYKAEGTYCRFEGNESRGMIWGRLYRKEGAGQFEDEYSECIDHCRNKDLRLVYQYGGDEASHTVTLDDPPEFLFVVDIDDPGKFSLGLILQKTVAIIGQEAPAVTVGGFVLRDFKPYVDGGANYCPPNLMRRVPSTKPGYFPLGQPQNSITTRP